MSGSSQQSQYLPQSVPCGQPACEGRKSITIAIDFSLGNTFSLDLSAVQSNTKFINSVQAFYLDNTQNANPVIFTMGATLQSIRIPAGKAAYMPILQPNPPQLVVQCATASIIKLQLLNFFVPPVVWDGSGSPSYSGGALIVTDQTLDACVSGGALNVNAQPVTLQGMTDASGTITTGGTGQLLIAASPSRKRWTICNPASATEVLQFAYGNAAAGYIDIPAGSTWDESNLTVVGDAVYIKAATTGHAFTAYYK